METTEWLMSPWEQWWGVQELYYKEKPYGTIIMDNTPYTGLKIYGKNIVQEYRRGFTGIQILIFDCKLFLIII